MSTTFSSPLELGSRVTSTFGKRWGTLHAGYDYGPPKIGQKRRPIHAVADGPVLRTGRGNGKANARVVPYHSGLGIWQDLGWHGGDRMRAYYGHLDEILVRPGQRVKAGDVIGYMGGSGASGANDFAVHLHFGIAQNHDRPVHAAGKARAPGWINPQAWLLSKGIRVGASRPVSSISNASPVQVKPVPEPKPTPAPIPKEWSDMASKEEISALFDARLKKFFSEDESIPWKDYETGKEKMLTRDQALRYGLAPQTTEKVVTKVLTEDLLVNWPDSVTKELKPSSVTRTLGNIGTHWSRELDRDIAGQKLADAPVANPDQDKEGE